MLVKAKHLGGLALLGGLAAGGLRLVGGTDLPQPFVSDRVPPGIAADAASPPAVGAWLSFAPVGDWTVFLSSKDGSTASALFWVGPLSGASTSDDTTEGAACTVDPQRDAIVPFGVQLTSTTQGFTTSPSLKFSAFERDGSLLGSRNPRMSAEWTFDEGPECTEVGDGRRFGVKATDKSLGKGIAGEGRLVLHDYYSPGAPGGDPARMRQTFLVLADEANDGPGWFVKSISGDPAMIEHLLFHNDSWIIPLDGSSTIRCGGEGCSGMEYFNGAE